MLTRRLLLGSLIPLSGCATLRSDVVFSYQPPRGGKQATDALKGLKLVVIPAHDRRLLMTKGGVVTDPRVIFRKRDDFGRFTGGVIAADRPFTDYVTEAFESGFLNRGGIMSPTAAASLTVVIYDLNDSLDSRGFFKSEMSLKLEAEAQLLDSTKVGTLWRSRVSGSAPVNTSGVPFAGVNLLESLSPLLDDLVSQVLDDTRFREAFRGASVA